MSCNADYYNAIWNWIISKFNWITDQLAQLFGDRWLAYIFIALAMLPLTFLFGYASKVVVPQIVKWYYGKTITERALDWWQRNGLAFIGFKHSTAVISVAAGAAFYFLIRIAAAFPDNYWITIPGVATIFIGIAFLGYAVSGKVPDNYDDRNRYFKRFHSPTVTGLGLGAATIMLDFTIHSVTVMVKYLQAT